MRDPLIKDLHHIEARDALISWKRIRPLVDDRGEPVLRAVGVSDKKAERRMEQVKEHLGVQVAPWPDADYIVGNPPFLGNKQMNDELGAGYVDAIKGAYPGVNGSADLVMWWWWRAADLVAQGRLKRFGLVTTNSITQTFDRVVVANAVEKKGLHLAYAVPDHPWYDEGAAVRIAMTVATREAVTPVLGRVVDESRTRAVELEHVRVLDTPVGEIPPTLAIGAKVASARPLRANERLCIQGFNFVGKGFQLSRSELEKLGYDPDRLPSVVRRCVSGKDVAKRMSEQYVIDFHGLDADDALTRFAPLWNRVVRLVKPQRERQNDEQRREQWWLFGRSGAEIRRALSGVTRFIGTSRTAKHRVFALIDAEMMPNTEVVVVAVDGGWVFGVMCSRVHLAWAHATRGTLEDRPRYFHTTSFAPFPFPDAGEAQRARIAKLGEAIDAHRKARQKADPKLELTAVYNVIAKLRANGKLTDGEKIVRECALADTLRDLHDELDAAVIDAYGWPAKVSDEDILTRLVALNAERAAEEAKGKIRWLRPEFQAPGAITVTPTLPTTTPKGPKPKAAKPAARPKWPKADPPKYALVVDVLASLDGSAPLDEILGAIDGADTNDVVNVLACLAAAQRTAYVDDGDGPRWILRA